MLSDRQFSADLAHTRRTAFMKFTDRELLEGTYKWAFLDAVDREAPEVLESLKALAPKFKTVFGQGFNTRSNVMATWLCTSANTAYELHDLERRLNPVWTLYDITQDSHYLQINKADLTPEDNKKLLDFFELRDGYQAFIERFGLETEWLRMDLFQFLSDLAHRPEYFKGSLLLAYSHGQCVREGDPFIFQINGWSIDRDSDDFEQSARSKFNAQLQEYIRATAKEFQADGYKRSRSRDLKRVKWLVIWNLSDVEDLWEVIQHIPEFENVNLEHTKQRKSTVDKLRKAFEEFEKYDLPVRPWKMKVEK